MKRLALLTLMLATSAVCQVGDGRRFQEARMGGPVEGLPFPCKQTLFCEGALGGRWVRVSFDASRTITMIQVIYNGERSDGTAVTTVPKVGLLDALIENSFANNPTQLDLATYTSADGLTHSWVDLTNFIVYEDAEGGRGILSVAYVQATAPILTAAHRSATSDLLAGAMFRDFLTLRKKKKK